MSVSTATLLAKISALEARMNNVAPTVLSNEAGVTPLLVISNASFLATLSNQHPASKATALSDTHMPTASSTYSSSQIQGAYNRINDLIDYVNILAGNLNDLFDALQSTNIIT